MVYGLLPLAGGITLGISTARRWCTLFSRPLTAWLLGLVIVALMCFVDIHLYLRWQMMSDDRIALRWNPESGEFNWGSGSVRIPKGFEYQSELGIDTFVGRFTTRFDRTVIQHDIGELAYEHGSPRSPESLSFPDSGCAVFYVEAPPERRAEIIETLRTSFRPSHWKLAWMRPLLPEILRTDCHYRFRAPFK